MRRGLLALALALSAGACSIDINGDEASLTVHNRSSTIVDEVRLSYAGDHTWGRNQLRRELMPGDEVVVYGIDCADYDVMVVDTQGARCVVDRMFMCWGDELLVIDDGMMRDCGFN